MGTEWTECRTVRLAMCPKTKAAPQAEAEAQMSDPRIPYLLREARYLIRIGQWNDKTMRIETKSNNQSNSNEQGRG
jgi:hypothetical protein